MEEFTYLIFFFLFWFLSLQYLFVWVPAIEIGMSSFCSDILVGDYSIWISSFEKFILYVLSM